MKTLCTALAFVLLASASAADSDNLTFNQVQGDDGLYHIDVGVSYVFSGQPPRTNNSGVGTVRITLPNADLSAPSADAGYTCHTEAPSAVACSADGQPNDRGGLTFPTSVTVHIVASACWSSPGGTADIWSAPNDPGTTPDTTLTIDAPDCGPTTPQQPVLEGHTANCKVPKLKGVPLPSATRRLVNAHCARGKVTRKHSATVKKGSVVSQSFKPGKILKEKTKVNLVVSSG